MEKVSKYNTKQRESILHYLKSAPKSHVSAEDIIKYFKEINEPIGKSTIYRYLNILVNKKVIQKYNIDSSSPACYKYAEADDCLNHYHCKCSECGELIHVDCDVFENLKKHMKIDHKFEIDTSRIILYGKCEKCAK